MNLHASRRIRWPPGRVMGGDGEVEELTEAIELFNGETNVIEDAFEETFLERSTGVDGHGHAAVIRRSSQGHVAASLVGFFEAEAAQDGEELAGREDGEFLTAHAERSRARCR